jgi:hypothetical protein
MKKKNSQKSRNSSKNKNEDNDSGEEKTNSTSGKYIYFRNPKYRSYANKFSQMSLDEIQDTITKMKFNLQEKIHIGNMLSNLAANITQQGQYNPGDKTCYNDQKKFEELYNQCMNYTRVKLQKLCELNELPKSAGKNVLAERIADAMLLGKIPKCPSCNGGRLRFNLLKGTYYCPGYIDGGHFYQDLGDDYIFCNRTFEFDQINIIDFVNDH